MIGSYVISDFADVACAELTSLSAIVLLNVFNGDLRAMKRCILSSMASWSMGVYIILLLLRFPLTFARYTYITWNE